MRVHHSARSVRGATAVEFALLLPLLAFLFAIAIDYGRIFYYTVTCENCARNGAMWLADPVLQTESPYTTVEDAATADASDLSPTPTVTKVTYADNQTDAFGVVYVEVTVHYTFNSVTNFPLIPSSYEIKRTVRMYQAPAAPKGF